MAFSTFIFAVLLALVLGALAGWYWARRAGGSPEALQQQNARLSAELAAAVSTRDLLSDKLADLEERNRSDSDLLRMLTPVRDRLATMENSVRDMENQRAQQYGAVAEALRSSAHTQEQLRHLTESLSSALKSSSARGTWGEAQLKRVVEAAGMIPHVSYAEQVSTEATSSRDQDRTVRPDMVVYLPGDKTLVIDAKAPLSAYLSAQEAEGAQAQEALAKHAKAVRAHIDTLSHKKYWDGFDSSPELVLCFIPVESALAAALQADPGLLDYAAAKKVALVSPISLLATLKAISFSWRQDTLTDNARELLRLSQQLYERLGTAGTHLASMGKRLNSTVESYNSLVGSLETRVFVTARKIAELDSASLGAKLSPQPLDSVTKPLTAQEFLTGEPDT